MPRVGSGRLTQYHIKMIPLQLLLMLPLLGATPLDDPGTQEPTEASAPTEELQEPGKIAWFGRWQDALEESERTKRPILLMSAVPKCGGTPGMW